MVDPQQVFSDPKVIALARAAAAGKPAEVEVLLHRGVNVKTVGQKGFTVTHFALLARENASGVLRLLLNAGADPISEEIRSASDGVAGL